MQSSETLSQQFLRTSLTHQFLLPERARSSSVLLKDATNISNSTSNSHQQRRRDVRRQMPSQVGLSTTKSQHRSNYATHHHTVCNFSERQLRDSTTPRLRNSATTATAPHRDHTTTTLRPHCDHTATTLQRRDTTAAPHLRDSATTHLRDSATPQPTKVATPRLRNNVATPQLRNSATPQLRNSATPQTMSRLRNNVASPQLRATTSQQTKRTPTTFALLSFNPAGMCP